MEHKSRNLQFILVLVDDFSINYLNNKDLDNLIATLEEHFY